MRALQARMIQHRNKGLITAKEEAVRCLPYQNFQLNDVSFTLRKL